jgi:ABC-type multidrug transport system ATPase subunit
MNVLAARVSGLSDSNTKLTGSVELNGVERDEVGFRRISAYVVQDDRLYPHMTVEETFTMAAHFYLPDVYSLDQKKLLVDSVIAELGLDKARNTMIGDEKVRGVSGGERKRANIGVQLISNPSILFLDEPTSGLDSFQSQAVMESMKAMTAHGRLVITVIHQPRSSIFEMFDKLLLLSDGRVMYMGDAHGAGEYLNSVGFAVPRFFNPADFFLDVLSPDTRTSELDKDSTSRIRHLADIWASKPSNDSLAVGSEAYGTIQSLNVNETWSFSKWQRTMQLLFWRAWIEVLRNRAVIIVKIVMSCIFSGVIGGMYSNVGYNQISITNRFVNTCLDDRMLFVVVD